MELALTLRLVPLQPHFRGVPKVEAQNEIVRNQQFRLDFSFKEKPHHHSATVSISQNLLLTPSFLSESVHTHCPSGSVAWHEARILPWVESFAFHCCAAPLAFCPRAEVKGDRKGKPWSRIPCTVVLLEPGVTPHHTNTTTTHLGHLLWVLAYGPFFKRELLPSPLPLRICSQLRVQVLTLAAIPLEG